MISIESRQGELLNPLRNILDTFPGDVFEGDLTGHRYEWRAEYAVDRAPSNQDETEDDEFVLTLSIFPESGTGSFCTELYLEHYVPEVGIESKERIAVSDLESMASALGKIAIEWDLRNDVVEIAGPYLSKVAEVARQISGGEHA